MLEAVLQRHEHMLNKADRTMRVVRVEFPSGSRLIGAQFPAPPLYPLLDAVREGWKLVRRASPGPFDPCLSIEVFNELHFEPYLWCNRLCPDLSVSYKRFIRNFIASQEFRMLRLTAGLRGPQTSKLPAVLADRHPKR